MEKLLQGKVALVTGASRGIGRAIATKLASHGADVIITHLCSEEQVQPLAEELKNLGGRVYTYQSNAADFNATSELVANVVEQCGKLDILVNNAGITKDNLLLRMGEEDWTEVVRVNLQSCFNAVKAATRTFLKQWFDHQHLFSSGCEG